MFKLKKKVLVNQERLKYPFSGLGYYCRCLEEGLKAGGLQDLHLLLYSRGFKFRDHRLHMRIYRYFNPTTWDVDLLHVTNQLDRYFIKTFACKRVVTLHDLNFLHENLKPYQYGIRLQQTADNLNLADVIVCISEFVRQDLLANAHLFNLKEGVKIEVIHNGLILDELRETGGLDKLSSEVNSCGVGSYILNIATLHEKKNQLLLVRMLSHLPEDVRLVCVYSGQDPRYKRVLMEEVDKLGLGHRVFLLCEISQEEKNYLLHHCLAYMHPSTAEGFGLPPVEAMYLGKPTFLSKATSLPEVGGNVAYYFDELTPEQMLLDFEKGMEDYRANSNKSAELHSWAQQFDYRVMAEKYAKVYRDLLSEK